MPLPRMERLGRKQSDGIGSGFLSYLKLSYIYLFFNIQVQKKDLIYLCIGIVCQFIAPLFVSSRTFPSGLYHFLHTTFSSIFWWHVLLKQLLCLSFLIFSLTCISFYPPCDGLIFMVGLSPVHGSIYFGSLVFLIFFITTALFPSACTSWALYCVQHILTHSCLVLQCFVKWKKQKNTHFRHQ